MPRLLNRCTRPDELYETIEGTDVPSPGTRDMPIWGLSYRILALIEYINRLQVR